MGGGAKPTLPNIAVSSSGKAQLLTELEKTGTKLTPENVVAISKLNDGRIVFLEHGNAKAGFRHIVQEHEDDFAKIGVQKSQIPDVLMQAISYGKIVGYQGSGSGRPIYELSINGQRQQLAITVGNNGFIVGANPAGRVK